MDCSICHEKIEVEEGGFKEGHNAWPVADVRCCTSCNNLVVIQRRINPFVIPSCPECEHPIPDYELSSKCPTCVGNI